MISHQLLQVDGNRNASFQLEVFYCSLKKSGERGIEAVRMKGLKHTYKPSNPPPSGWRPFGCRVRRRDGDDRHRRKGLLCSPNTPPPSPRPENQTDGPEDRVSGGQQSGEVGPGDEGRPATVRCRPREGRRGGRHGRSWGGEKHRRRAETGGAGAAR